MDSLEPAMWCDAENPHDDRDRRPRRRLEDVEGVFDRDGGNGDVGWVVLVDLLAVDVIVEDDRLRCLPREGQRDGGDGLPDHLPVVLAWVLGGESSRVANLGRYVPVVVFVTVAFSSSFVAKRGSATDTANCC
jgi:hypothetical protein